MSLFDLGKACVFSPVEGVVTVQGEPVSGAAIKRKVTWQSAVEDQATTDSKGRFRFGALHQRSLASFLPMEFVAHQTLTLEHSGKEYLLWETTKRSEEVNAELEGRAIKIACELTNEPTIKYAGQAAVDGICTFAD